jgi:predicted enzyme related to lactoylglutathione lyase
MFNHTKAFSGFSVDDSEKAKKFYAEVLGLQVEDTEMPGVFHLHIAGSNRILVYAKPNHTPATYTVLNFPVSNIEDAIAQLTHRGVRFRVYDDPNFRTDEKGIFRGGGPLIAWFKDPAGNILSVIEEE